MTQQELNQINADTAKATGLEPAWLQAEAEYLLTLCSDDQFRRIARATIAAYRTK